MPQRLWWDLLVICLHPHWLILHPCEIHLPIKLGAPLIRFWQQMLQNGLDTVHAYGPPNDVAPLGITFVDGDLHVPHDAITGSVTEQHSAAESQDHCKHAEDRPQTLRPKTAADIADVPHARFECADHDR